MISLKCREVKDSFSCWRKSISYRSRSPNTRAAHPATNLSRRFFSQLQNCMLHRMACVYQYSIFANYARVVQLTIVAGDEDKGQC